MMFPTKKKPVELYGELQYVGFDTDENIHFYVKKDSSKAVTLHILRELKALEKRDVRIKVEILKW